MSKRNTLLVAGGAVLVAGLVVYMFRRHRSNKRHAIAADEGYEMAYDVLFPKKKPRGQKLQYGPVLPE